MTREEAIDVIQRLSHTEAKWPGTEDTLEALDMAIDALRPVSREQVETAWKGCKHCTEEWGTCDPITNRFRMPPRAAAAGNAPGIAAEAPQHETTEHSTWHEWIAGRFGDVR